MPPSGSYFGGPFKRVNGAVVSQDPILAPSVNGISLLPDGLSIVADKPIEAPSINGLGDETLAYVIDASQLTAAQVQAQVDALSEFFGILVPFGHTLVLDEPLRIEHKKHVRIYGGGTIQGTVRIGAYIYGDPEPAVDIKIKDVAFDSGRLVWENGESNGLNAIELHSVTGAQVSCVSFRGYDTCVFLSNEQLYSGITRHACECLIQGCGTRRDSQPNTMAGRVITYPNYFVRSENNGLNTYRYADISISNNINVHNSITNVELWGIDGVTIANNIFFLPGHFDRSQIKKHNVFINAVQWTAITGNKFFEAGLESVRLNKFANISICGNEIAWHGQRVESYGIKVTGGKNLGSTTGDTICSTTISANGISRGSGGGIRIDSGCDNISCTGNNGDLLGSTETYYGDGTNPEGPTAVPALVGPAYAVSVSDECYGVSAYENNFYGGVYDLLPSTVDPGNRGRGLHLAGPHYDRNVGLNGEEKKVVTIANPSGVLDCQSADLVYLTGTGGTITNVTGLRYNRRTTIINFASRCIVKHVGGTSIALVGSRDAIIPNGGRLELIKAYDATDATVQRIYEVARTFDDPKVTASIAATTRIYQGAQDVVVLTGSTASQTLTLDDNYGSRSVARIRNRSTQTWTIAAQAGKTINGSASITLAAGASIDLYDDSTTAWLG